MIAVLLLIILRIRIASVNFYFSTGFWESKIDPVNFLAGEFSAVSWALTPVTAAKVTLPGSLQPAAPAGGQNRANHAASVKD